MSWDWNTRTSAYKKCKKLVSKIVEEKEETVIWVLEDWEKTWQVLRKCSTCKVNLGNVSLLFSLSEPVEGTWLSLLVRPQYTGSFRGASRKELTFKCQVDELTQNLAINAEFLPATYFTISGNSQITMEKKFIEISNSSQENRLQFGIFCSDVNFKSELDGACGEQGRRTQNGRADGAMPMTLTSRAYPNEVVRVTLAKGEDFMAKREILEKCTHLDELMVEAELEGEDEDDFGFERPECLNICVDVDAEVMPIIMKWLELEECPPFSSEAAKDRMSGLMSKIVDAAQELGLADLVEYLDRNMASYCTPRNKENLLQVASDYDLENAEAAIEKWTTCKKSR